jgi:hypothetical protein
METITPEGLSSFIYSRNLAKQESDIENICNLQIAPRASPTTLASEILASHAKLTA